MYWLWSWLITYSTDSAAKRKKQIMINSRQLQLAISQLVLAPQWSNLPSLSPQPPLSFSPSSSNPLIIQPPLYLSLLYVTSLTLSSSVFGAAAVWYIPSLSRSVSLYCEWCYTCSISLLFCWMALFRAVALLMVEGSSLPLSLSLLWDLSFSWDTYRNTGVRDSYKHSLRP